MLRQMTGTAYILEGELALLVWHRKFQKWQPPGGHSEEGELPHETALREALEETAAAIEIISAPGEQPPSLTRTLTSVVLPRPYRLMLQDIPAYRDQPRHQHFDFCYVAKRLEPLSPLPSNHENNLVGWFNLAQLRDLHDKGQLFSDTLQIFESLLTPQATANAAPGPLL